MKRFKSKKIKKKNIRINFLIFLFFIFFSYVFTIKYIKKYKFNNLLDKKTNYINFNILNYLDNKAQKLVKNPTNLIEYTKYYKENNIKIKSNLNKKLSNNELIDTKPFIYIYNTHQNEEYVDYNVYDAANYLSKMLNTDKYYSFLQNENISSFLKTNNMKYYESYKASRYFLNKNYDENNSLKYFFDIHRDSVSKNKTTLEYNGKKYAKILFIIGMENKNNAYNLKNTEILSNIINSKVNYLSKGIYKKAGKNVNGVYNQDFSNYVFLVEIGSKDNTKEEVENTIIILKDSIKEFINNNDQL